VCAFGRPPSSWSRLLDEAIKPGRGVLGVSLWHALCNESTPFFFFEDGPVNPAVSAVYLVVFLGTEHSMNGDCRSFR